ncbi:MAG: hypothetical protein Q8R02_03240 [Hyphomonadaceae bacterium]|nr:hypothetical protein [Hyphomonadaceae bacterium]
MLKAAQEHPILCACAVVAVASFFVMGFYGADSELAMFAFFPLATACLVALVILNYQVFGGKTRSTIYRPDASPDDRPR